MKVLSIWQPYASLAVHGFKTVETRSYPVGEWAHGTRIGIASTKRIVAAQRAVMKDEEFLKQYGKTGLPELKELPHGFLIGTAIIETCYRIAQCHLGALGAERVFGDWRPGRYAWVLKDPEVWAEPVPVRGLQRMWNFQPA